VVPIILSGSADLKNSCWARRLYLSSWARAGTVHSAARSCTIKTNQIL